jgi:hypothetical protein
MNPSWPMSHSPHKEKSDPPAYINKQLPKDDDIKYLRLHLDRELPSANTNKQKTNSVALSPQANYTD